jgi:two-component system chemotaxis response regulator CheB
MSDPVRILIVDDSRLFRSALEDALAGARDVEVVGSVFNGEKAMEFIRASPPDLVTLDVEMPGLSGLETLGRIQEYNASQPGRRAVGAIMVSSFTKRGASTTLAALEAGAFDFVTKPSGASAEQSIEALSVELLAKVRAFGQTVRQRGAVAGGAGGRGEGAGASRGSVKRAAVKPTAKAIVIGASTGGPKALAELMPRLCSMVDLPILIVQHMPVSFTLSLAESLGRQTGWASCEAVEGAAVERSNIYVAPGGRHLVVRGAASAPVVGVNEQPPENGCRPSADVLFRSAAATFGGETVAIILTGMGRDGTAGLGAVKRAGGYVIAQDEASSVVWGMPGSAVEAGVTHEVLPLNQIARAVATIVKGGAATGT